jgi:hypothetical protein
MAEPANLPSFSASEDIIETTAPSFTSFSICSRLSGASVKIEKNTENRSLRTILAEMISR